MQHSAATLLFPGYRRAVLGLLLLNAEDSLHGREIARRLHLPSGTIIRELNRLCDAELLNREKRGNQTFYSANRQSPIFSELASILRKTSGIADVLRAALEPLAQRITTAFIYGSVARGAETSGSDIDVIIIGAVDLGSVIDALYPTQKTLAREINPRVFSPDEWTARLKEHAPFILDVIERPKIFLIGAQDGLGQPDRQKPGHRDPRQGVRPTASRRRRSTNRRR